MVAESTTQKELLAEEKQQINRSKAMWVTNKYINTSIFILSVLANFENEPVYITIFKLFSCLKWMEN